MKTTTAVKAAMDISNSTGDSTGYRVMGSGGATS